ncbi:MAG: hypothetical protein PHT54_04185, partial [Candidatus Nanoarchaeia archaeon]|nr:hypothetical protein [Candidatus Nanoarchaeia archaeon]
METQQKSILDNGKITTILFVLFIIVLTLLSVFSNKLSFHDDMEYIVVAKDLAGFENSKVFSSHSIVYPFIISLFLKIAFSELTLKLVNMVWFILIAFVLFKLSSRKSFLLWIFAPIAYILFPQTSPTAPAAFFILLGYLMIKKHENEQKIKYFILSALCLGMSFALYTPSILPIILFIIAFFYDKKLANLFYYLAWMLPTIAITLILDYIYFGNPFYSIIWYMGVNILIALGLNQNIAFSQISNIGGSILLFLVGISPLLFKIVKLDFKKYKRELIIIIPLVLFFIFRAAAELKYMLLIAPIILILLSTVLTKKQIIISAVI